MKITDQKLILQNQVSKFGFTLYSYSGDRLSFDFVTEEAIHLNIWIEAKQAELVYIYAMFTIKSGLFSWPHPSFNRIFLSRMKSIVNRLTV